MAVDYIGGSKCFGGGRREPPSERRDRLAREKRMAEEERRRSELAEWAIANMSVFIAECRSRHADDGSV